MTRGYPEASFGKCIRISLLPGAVGVGRNRGTEENTDILEPTPLSNPELVKEEFAKKRAWLPYVAIQGHPNQWDDVRFDYFKKAVLYLREQGCRFVTPSEYLAAQKAQKPAK